MSDLRWLWFAILLLAACNTPDALPPTATTVRVIQATIVPTIDRALHPVAASQTPPVQPTADRCVSTAAQPAVQHTVNAGIDYTARTVRVQQHVRALNRGSAPLEQVVFNIEPNRAPGAFTLESVTADRDVLAYELTGRRLTVQLAEPFLPGCPLEIDLDYHLNVAPVGEGVSAFGGYFGYTDRQLNLGLWLAALAARRDGEWITHDVAAIGEQTTLDVADWDVTLTVENAPETLVVAAPGTLVMHEGNQWRYRITAARDFTVSMSPLYDVLTTATDGGVTVEVYGFDDRIVDTPSGRVDGGEQALQAAVQSLSMYADLFGAYPYARFLIVQGDFPDGMEFTGIVYVSNQWFRTNTGTPQSYLTIITVHETAHQWWYARVGSDQALDPFLDEALATYSEYIFYEEYYPDLKTWWWNFRVSAFVPPDYTGKGVDSSVFEFDTARDYINAVYLRGAQMLDAIRGVIGTDAFFDLLRRYSEAGQGRVVAPDVFWSLLAPEQLEQISDIRARYLDDVTP